MLRHPPARPPPPHAAQLVAAVGTLYGSDPVSANDANAWLQQVAASPQAWELCLRVLAAPAHGQETLYFAANVLLSKVRREWGDLPQDTRTHLTQAMRCAAAAPGGTAGGGEGRRAGDRRARR